MAKIYDIKVRFMRRVQVREYEPAEAEVTLSAQVADDEDYQNAANELMTEARIAVKAGLTGKPAEAKEPVSVKKQVETKTKPKGKPVPKKAKTTIPDDVIPDGVEPEKTEETEPVKKVATKKKAAPKKVVRTPEPELIPEDNDAPVMSIQDLQGFVGSAVTSRKIKPAQIKEIISAYKAVRLSDIPEASRSAVKVAIENAMLLE